VEEAEEAKAENTWNCKT